MMARGRLGGVVAKRFEIEACLIEQLLDNLFETISPTHHVWPPATSVGERAWSIAAVYADGTANITLQSTPLCP